jgi:hypothetical protein
MHHSNKEREWQSGRCKLSVISCTSRSARTDDVAEEFLVELGVGARGDAAVAEGCGDDVFVDSDAFMVDDPFVDDEFMEKRDLDAAASDVFVDEEFVGAVESAEDDDADDAAAALSWLAEMMPLITVAAQRVKDHAAKGLYQHICTNLPDTALRSPSAAPLAQDLQSHHSAACFRFGSTIADLLQDACP